LKVGALIDGCPPALPEGVKELTPTLKLVAVLGVNA